MSRTPGNGWVELCLTVPAEQLEPLSARLFMLGTLGVQEDHLPGEAPPPRQPWDASPPPPAPSRVLLRAWWTAAALPRETVEQAVAALPGTEVVGWAPVSPSDWSESWKRRFHRFEVSSDLAVAPPWEAQPGDLVIEPGMAFGTGDHPTTRACLDAIARLARPRERCLDVGSGSGILALAAAKLGMAVRGIDVDPTAVREARVNAGRNGLLAVFDDTPLTSLTESYDLVVANIYAEVLVELAPDLVRLTGRHLVLAGILAERSAMVEAAFAALRLVARHEASGWVALIYER